MSTVIFAGCLGTGEPKFTNENNTENKIHINDSETEEPVWGRAELHVALEEDESRKDIDEIAPSDQPNLANNNILQEAFDDAVETGLWRYSTRDESIINQLDETIVQITMHDDGLRYVDHDGHLLSIQFGVDD